MTATAFCAGGPCAGPVRPQPDTASTIDDVAKKLRRAWPARGPLPARLNPKLRKLEAGDADTGLPRWSALSIVPLHWRHEPVFPNGDRLRSQCAAVLFARQSKDLGPRRQLRALPGLQSHNGDAR